jgi:hypothetical protein
MSACQDTGDECSPLSTGKQTIAGERPSAADGTFRAEGAYLTVSDLGVIVLQNSL